MTSDIVHEVPNSLSAREIYGLIATRNRPMLTALDLCIEQLERFAKDDPDAQCALRCATKAAKLEREFQSRAPLDAGP